MKNSRAISSACCNIALALALCSTFTFFSPFATHFLVSLFIVPQTQARQTGRPNQMNWKQSGRRNNIMNATCAHLFIVGEARRRYNSLEEKSSITSIYTIRSPSTQGDREERIHILPFNNSKGRKKDEKNPTGCPRQSNYGTSRRTTGPEQQGRSWRGTSGQDNSHKFSPWGHILHFNSIPY